MKKEINCASCSEIMQVYCAGNLSEGKGENGLACQQDHPIILRPGKLQPIQPDIIINTTPTEIE